jgi:hypothetical protein
MILALVATGWNFDICHVVFVVLFLFNHRHTPMLRLGKIRQVLTLDPSFGLPGSFHRHFTSLISSAFSLRILD